MGFTLSSYLQRRLIILLEQSLLVRHCRTVVLDMILTSVLDLNTHMYF